MSRPLVDLRLYAVLDPTRTAGRDPVDLVEAAARGGVTLVQLRHKLAGTREFIDLARAVRRRLEPFAIPLLINDRVDVALAASAGGVHVGQSDMEAGDARRLLGDDAIIGVTVHHPHEARAIDPAVTDYAGIGPVFLTSSKDPGSPPIGPGGLAALLPLPGGVPVCGIAGIDHTNAASVVKAGAAGVAVISDIFMADDVEGATRRLRATVDGALS